MAHSTCDSGPNEDAGVRPWDPLNEAANRFLADLTCLSDMQSFIAPALAEKDQERIADIRAIAEKLRSAGRLKQAGVNEYVHIKEALKRVKALHSADRMFRQSQIISTVSRFDLFFSKALGLAYKQNIGWLKNPEKKVSYKELLESNSFDEFKESLLDREVELHMRESHFSQISFLDSKLKLGIVENFTEWKTFLEITERRNVFVHCGGLISQQYLDRCEEYGIEIPHEARLGKTLGATDSYIRNAMEVFFELAIRILQSIWRRLFPNSLEAADSALNSIGYSLLEEGRWALAENVFRFFTSIPAKLKSQGDVIYYGVINQCIAMKNQGKDISAVLGATNWKQFHPAWHLVCAVIEGDFGKAAGLMRSEAVWQWIREENFSLWVLFKEFRETEDFRQAYRDVFKKDFELELTQRIETSVRDELAAPEGEGQDIKDPDTSSDIQANG